MIDSLDFTEEKIEFIESVGLFVSCLPGCVMGYASSRSHKFSSPEQEAAVAAEGLRLTYGE